MTNNIKTECIIASFNYSDFLSVTLPVNKCQFDRVVVYTKSDDLDTQGICALNNVECVLSDAFTRNGAKFNRGAVYNEAFSNLKFNEWICLMDSDVILPKSFKQDFMSLNPERELFYGARRYNVETPELFSKIRQDASILESVLMFRGFGYGYFQMFHYDSSVFRNDCGKKYPESFSCAESDWIFRNKWGEEIFDPMIRGDADHAAKNVKDHGSRLLRCLPFPVIHLGVTGVNSTERKTAKWCR